MMNNSMTRAAYTQELGEAGADVQVGSLSLRLTGAIVDEPGRGAGFTDLAPRLMLHLDDAEASGLLVEGARAQYGLLARTTPEARAGLGEMELPEGVRRVSPQSSRPELTQALARAETFLAIASSAASLLAAAAIALSAWQFGLALRDEVALLKCLGASGGQILRTLGLMLAMLGVVGGVLGAALGGHHLLGAPLLLVGVYLTLPNERRR